MKKEIKTKNGNKIILKQVGANTMVDMGKKVIMLQMGIERAVAFINTLGL